MSQIPVGPGWHLAVAKGSSYALRVDVTEAEFESYRKSIGAINGLRGQFGIKLIEKNYHDYRNVKGYLGIVMSVGRAIASPDRTQLAESIMGQLIGLPPADRTRCYAACAMC